MKEFIWASLFKREIKQIAKKYPMVYNDISEPAVKLMAGMVLGKPVKNTSGVSLRTVRVKNSSSNTGKSGGFRVLYHHTEDAVAFVSICSRPDALYISTEKMMSILEMEGLI